MNKLAKKLVVAALVAFASSSVLAAADSYLYWMAADSIVNRLGGNVVDYKYAKVNFGGSVDKNGNVTGGTWLNPYAGGSKIIDESGEAVDYLTKSVASGGPLYWGAIDSSAGSSFIFELFVDGGESEGMQLVGWNSASYSEVLNAIAKVDGTSTPGGVSYYTLTSVVPEPTSGLLSLFGLAMLALRRRRRA